MKKINTNTDLANIKKQTLSFKELTNYKVFLFGSRAKWNFTKNSDYDIGFLGDSKMDFNTYLSLKRKFQDLPYNIDLIDFNRVSDEFKNLALKNIILWN